MKNPTLFNAILTNPLDDAPRLAYAKWLRDNGDKDRAEFIKVQCDRATKDRFDPAQERLAKKEKALLKKHEKEWLAELPEWARQGARFHRGFVGVLRVDLKEVVKGLADLGKVTPVSGVELSSGGADAKSVAALARCPQGAQFTELTICYNEVGNAGVKAIAESPFFANLKKLHLFSIGMTALGAKALAASPHLVGLTDLSLELGPNGLKSVLSSQWKPTKVDFTNVPLAGAAASSLARWEGLASVVELGIANCGIGPDEVKAFASSPYLKNLRVLKIDNNPLTAAGIDALAGAPWLPQLVELHIQNSRLSDEVGRAILAWPELPNLKKLISVNNQFTYETTLALIDRYGAT